MPPPILDRETGPVAPRVERSRAGGRLAGMTPSQARLMQMYYYAKVTHIDHGIGMVVDALERQGLLDDTWIFYTSDHGEMLGDHGCRNKAVFYEGALTVPLCIRPPGGVWGWRSAALTDHLDVVETLLAIAGADTLDGVEYRCSLLDLIHDGAGGPRAHTGKQTAFSEVMLYSMVRNDRFKLSVDTLTQAPVDLYDMQADPRELNNLVEAPDFAGVLDELVAGPLADLLHGLDRTRVEKYQETLRADPNRGGWKAIEKSA